MEANKGNHRMPTGKLLEPQPPNSSGERQKRSGQERRCLSNTTAQLLSNLRIAILGVYHFPKLVSIWLGVLILPARGCSLEKSETTTQGLEPIKALRVLVGNLSTDLNVHVGFADLKVFEVPLWRKWFHPPPLSSFHSEPQTSHK